MTAAVEIPRVVVYGDYAPFPTPAAAATLATVRSFLTDGRDIQVVSPRPSAAHDDADVGDPRGAAKLARLVGGAELVARFDPGILGRARGAGAGAARVALGLAVRRARSATIHLSPLTAPPEPRWVKAILGPAARVVVAGPDDAERLRSAGLDGARLSLADEPWWLPPPAEGRAGDGVGAAAPAAGEPWTVTPGASRQAIEAAVRARAAAHRTHEAANPVAASFPLHMLTPLSPAPAGSSKALFRLVKRAVHRLVAWEIVPIVEQINHLQRAAIESVDRQAEACAGAQPPAAETNS